MMSKRQTIKISRYSDPDRNNGFHHVSICVPNESVHISHDGENITLCAKWDKTRFDMPRIEMESRE